MRIVLVGASGTIGQAVAAELGERHEIVTVGSKSGDVRMDITDAGLDPRRPAQIGPFDALVSAAGKVKFAPLADMTEADYAHRPQGQADGPGQPGPDRPRAIADGGSFTLTSGVLSHDPVRSGSSASMVNGAIDGFVRAAAIELPRGLRINAVSPGVLVNRCRLRPLLPRPRAGPRRPGGAGLRQERRGRAHRPGVRGPLGHGSQQPGRALPA